MSVPIIYADEQLVVVDKPSMLLSVPGRGADKQDCVVTRLQADFPGIKEVHRLDWETSGLMLLARDRETHRELSKQFQQREVDKAYTCMVFGQMEVEEGEVHLPLRCDWPNRPRQMVDEEQGKPSHTQWYCLERNCDASRLHLIPHTGRSHQLRVHMMALGHPILGDGLYAHAQACAMAERLLLHAHQLGFIHPMNGERVYLKSPVPF